MGESSRKKEMCRVVMVNEMEREVRKKRQTGGRARQDKLRHGRRRSRIEGTDGKAVTVTVIAPTPVTVDGDSAVLVLQLRS